MPRTARIILAGGAHHVTQRGNRRMATFFCAKDYARYVDLVAEGCWSANVGVLACCLMPNHVHLILVPSSPGDSILALTAVGRVEFFTRPDTAREVSGLVKNANPTYDC